MRLRTLRAIPWLALSVALGLSVGPWAIWGASTPPPKDILGKLPLVFEANAGQAPPQFGYLARGGGVDYLFDAAGLTISWVDPTSASQTLPAARSGSPLEARSAPSQREPQTPLAPGPSHSLRLRFDGAEGHPSLAALDQLPGKMNYFSGPDPSNWHRDIATYRRVEYRNLYPGVDVVFYGKGRALEFDVVVAPGADPSALRIAVEGLGRQGLRLDGSDLLLTDGPSGLRLLEPVIYQEVDGGRRSVAGTYRLRGGSAFTVAPDRYDRGHTLVIDPTTQWGTYLGGSSSDDAHAVTRDGQGNIYLAGQTYSSNFPAVGGIPGTGGFAPYAFVTKLSPDGTTIVWSTVIRGTSGAGANAIAVDANGAVYLTGYTGPGFPTVSANQPLFGGMYDVFVAKIAPAGSSLLFSTYLGGSNWEEGHGIAVDSGGNCVVIGFTQSSDFPTLNAFQATLKANTDAFVARFGPTGTKLWSTYLGGTNPNGDRATGVAVDANGNAYVSGYTFSSDFPTVNPYQGTCKGCASGYQDAFLSDFNTSGGLVYSTFFGGNSASIGNAVAADAAGDAFLGGQTWASDLPVTPGAAQPYYSNTGVSDGFVAEFNPAGSQVLACTYLGGTDTDYVSGLSYVPQATGPGALGVVGTANSFLDNALPAVQDPNPAVTTFGTGFAGANNGSGGFTCGGFTSSPGLPMTSRVWPSDINGDGKDDIVALVPSHSEVYVMLNTGTGSFGPPIVSATRSYLPTDAVVTDFDGDGHPDVIVACRQSLTDPTKGAFNILYGKPDGHFIPAGPEWQVSGQPVGIAVADVNGDGYPDVVVAAQTPTGGLITTFLQDPVIHGSFLAPVNTAVPGRTPVRMAVFDYDHDSKPDLALLFPLSPGGYFSADSVGIFTGDGAGGFSSSTSLSTGIWPLDMAVADLNGDGVQDIAVLNYNDASISVFQGLAPGPGFAAPIVIPTTGFYPSHLFVGNLHSGSLPDLMVTFPVYHQTTQLFTNTSPVGGTISFSRSAFSCQQQAYLTFGHFFPPPAAPANAPTPPSPVFDVFFFGGSYYDVPFKAFLTLPNLTSGFFTIEGTGTCDAVGEGIFVDPSGNAFTTGDSLFGGVPSGPGSRPFGGGQNDGFLVIEPPPTFTFCHCASTPPTPSGQSTIHSVFNCGPDFFPTPQGPLAASSCPSGPVTIDPGDGTGPVEGADLIHDYAPGTYDFTVTGDFGQGNIQSCVGRVEIIPPPCTLECNTTADAFACIGELVPFACSPLAEGFGCPSGSFSYDWDFGDGTAHSSAQNPAHAYGNAGTFGWSLTLTFGNLTKTCSGSIEVCGLNCSVFALTPAGCAPLTTSFFQEIGQVGCVGTLTYEWDFGDGTTSTDPNPTHTYNTPGKYTWNVTITGANGCSCSASGTECVYNFPPASVPASGFTGCSVPFGATADIPAGCSGTALFSWNFGDDKSGTGANTSHTYTAAGTYTWTLTVTIGNVTCQQSGNIVICDFACAANAAPAVGFVPLDVTFTGNGTITGACPGAITYLWDFGDGTTSAAQNPPIHTYDTPGTYNWTLTVKVNGGCPRVCSGTVCVVDCWAHGPGAVCAGGIANFSASGLPGNCVANISWAWTFGDGGTSTDQNPAYSYPNAAATYNWSCTITVNGVPCTKNGATAVCKPVCTVTVPANGIAGVPVDFSGLMNAGNCAGAPVTFLWNFGDPASGGANTSPNQITTHTFATPGTYAWTFTGNLIGCLCVSAGVITIGPPCTLQCSATVPTVWMTGVPANFTAAATPANCPANPVYQWVFGDGNTSPNQNPTHAYAAPGTYNWTMTASVPGTTTSCVRTGTVVIVNPPVITLMKKSSPPFKITVTGSNLQSGIKVYINGVLWTSVTWKNTGKILLTGGTSLKAAVPKGVVTTFRFVNPDGGEVTLTWSW